MKKRRDIMQALQEDSRISSLEGNLRRLTSEVEAYRRFSERTCAQSGSKNHQEDLQKLVLDEQERVARLRDELAKAHEAFARERKEEANSRAAEVSALREEVQRLQFPRDQDPALTSREFSGPATEANATRRKQLETDMRLEQLARKDLERRLERAARRAERAESEVKELREQLQNLQREQRVKDAQLDAVRGDLQDLLLSHPSYDDDRSRRVDQTHARNFLLGGGPAAHAALPSTPSSSTGARAGASGAASFESKNEDLAALEGKGDDSENEEDFQDVLAAEMESMRVSYEEKMAVLQQRLEDAQRELKSARLG